MEKNTVNFASAADLRRQAEERLKAQKRTPQSDTDTQKLIHELQARQIDLDKQNEELSLSRAKMEAALERYTNLYEFAPVGYFTLSRDGTIIQCNLTGACLIGIERARLVNRCFGLFVSEANRPDFNAFLEKVFASKMEEVCDVALLKEEADPLWVHIEALASWDRKDCRAVVLDITERKRAEEALRKSEEKMQSIFRAAPTGIGVVIHRVFTEVNQRLCDMIGYTHDELIGQSSRMIYPSDADYEYVGREKYDQIAKTGTGAVETRFRRKDGTVIDILLSSTPMDPAHLSRGVTFTALDITGRKRAEEALRESDAQLRATLNAIPDIMFEVDGDGRIFGFHAANLEMLYAPPSQFLGKTVREVLPEGVSRVIIDAIGQAMERGRYQGGEYRLNMPGGSFWYELSVAAKGNHKEPGCRFIALAHDITERKRAEEALQKIGKMQSAILDNSTVGIAFVRDRVFEWVNPRMPELFGIPLEQLQGTSTRIVYPNDEAYEKLGAKFYTLLAQGKKATIEAEMRKGDGSSFWCRLEGNALDASKPQEGSIWIAEDITERKRAETELAQVDRGLRMLSQTNQAMIRFTDEVALLNEACRITVEVGGYRMAWVGFAEQDEAKTIRPVAWAGIESGYLESIKLSWMEDCDSGRGPGGIAIRTGQPCMARDIAGDPAFAPWREEALRRGYQSVIALPLTGEGRTFGTLGIYAGEADAFDVKELEILKKLATDLAFGIAAMRTRAERDQAAAALSAAGAYNRVLIEASLDPLVTIGPDGKITDANVATEVATGYARADLIGADFSNYFAEPEKARAGYQKVFRDGSVRDYPLELRHVDGHVTSVLYNASVYCDQKGQIAGVFAAARDITERKRTEQSLRMFRYCLDHASIAIEWIGADGKYTYVNEQTCRSLGYTAEELRQLHLWDIDPEYGKDRFFREWQQYQENRRGGGVFVETVHRRKDGVLFPVEVSSKHLWFGDTELHVAFVRDITERKQAEEALQKISKLQSAILDNSSVGISFVRNRVFEWVNSRMPELFGLTMEQFQGASTRIIYTDDEAYQRLGAEGYLLLAQGKKATIEAEMRKGDGSSFWCKIEGNALDASKPHEGSIWIWQDITERKRAEEALRRITEELQRSNRDLEQFAYICSHDLKEPLRMVTSFLGLLKKRYQGKLDENADQYIEFAVGGAARMQRLIEDLLAYSRVGRESATETVQVAHAVDAALENLRVSIQESGAVITRDPMPAIQTNLLELTQVFQNLIGNAIKFRAKGQRLEIHIGAENESGARGLGAGRGAQDRERMLFFPDTRTLTSGAWVFSVRDNGIGIDSRFHDKLFTVFQRLHSRDEYPGSGVGLAICKKIVERHGGRIGVESEEGKGALFYFTLPG